MTTGDAHRTVVVGGGLAGIAAAIRLADSGHDVTVLESRPRLGGATYSFQRDGMTVDTGQHVFLRCYDRYRDLLERLGVAHLAPVQERLEIPVLRPGNRVAALRRSDNGPPPLHLVRALATYRALSPWQRLRACAAANALRAVDPDDPVVDASTFGDWLRRHGQDQRTIDGLWGLLTVAALNIAPDEASLALAARVFRTGLLDDIRAGDIGMLTAPLSEVHDRPAHRAFDALGVRLRTGRVRAIDSAATGMVVRTDDGDLEADGVVLAVPHRVATSLVPRQAAPDAEAWEDLGASPIVNVHLLFDRPVTRMPFAATLGTDAQWIFDRSAAAGVEDGQYVVVSLSAADSLISVPAGQVREQQLAAMARVLPSSAHAGVRDAFVTREPHATFRQRAGTAGLRPQSATRWPSLALAGAWTATGWPDTMEGAVRSGLAAAHALTTQDTSHRWEMIT